MIDRNQRVVFLAENHAGAAPWYRLAYEAITEETPYAFAKPAQLTDPSGLAASCQPNRGPAGAPLFLVNHWITTDPLPLPSNADEGQRLRAVAAPRCASASGSATTSRTWSPSTSTAAATCSGPSTRSTASFDEAP